MTNKKVHGALGIWDLTKIAAFLSFSVFVTGCQTVHNYVPWFCPSLYRAPITDEICTGLGTSLRYDYTDTDAVNYFMTCYSHASDEAKAGVHLSERAAIRNSILFELMGMVDSEYARFEVNMRADRATKDILIKCFSLGLTGTATFAGGSASQILAGIDTGLKGGSEAWDVNMLGGKASELLNNTMRSERSKVEASIYDNMKLPIWKYPLEAGIRDVVKYYRQGHVTSALTMLVEQSALEAKNNADNADAAKK